MAPTHLVRLCDMATPHKQDLPGECLRPERAAVFALILSTFLGWAWWPVLRSVGHSWFEAPGRGVAPALLLLSAIPAARLRSQNRAPAQPDSAGLWLIFAAIVVRFAGTATENSSAATLSLVIAAFGIVLVCFGRRNIIWLLPPLLFLAVLLPLPNAVSHAVAEPLQQSVVSLGAWLAQLGGVAAVPAETIILADERVIDITGDCIGLASLIPFLALAGGLSLVWYRCWRHRAMLIVCGLPVGVVLLSARAAWQCVLPSAAATEGLMAWSGLLLLCLADGLLYGLAAMGRFLTTSPVTNDTHRRVAFKKTVPLTVTGTARSEAHP